MLTQLSVYGTDNRCMLDYMAKNLDRMRAVVAVGPEKNDSALEAVHMRGVRGIRVNVADPGGNPFAGFADLRRCAERLNLLGWHVELLLHVHQMDEVIADIRQLPVDISVGHLGFMPARRGSSRVPSDSRPRRRWQKLGKLTALYRISALARVALFGLDAFCPKIRRQRPDRILWGPDLPHPICPVAMPNEADLTDHLADWMPDKAVRQQILVDTPARLYGF